MVVRGTGGPGAQRQRFWGQGSEYGAAVRVWLASSSVTDEGETIGVGTGDGFFLRLG